MKKTTASLAKRLSALCLALALASNLPAATQPLSFKDLNGGLTVVIAAGDSHAGKVAATLAGSGDSVIHVLAGSRDEVDAINREIAAAELKGLVTVEDLKLSPLPYRDHMLNNLVVMDLKHAEAAGFTKGEARRCVAPQGNLVICRGGRPASVEKMPLPKTMDVWTHRYHGADGVPISEDKHLDLPIGFKWNADLPMNFDNPKRAANRYSSTRAMVVDDGRCFTFSSAALENLGEGWKSEYGTDQFLTARDAFNGRLLWRKRIGDTYYGGLYIENLAPLISTGRSLYLAGENGRMLKVDTRTGDTIAELPTQYIPGVIAASDGIVVAATWRDGKAMGSVKRYDRRRMDWAIDTGTIEAYDDKSGKLLWKQALLGTSMLIAEGRVFIVNRDAPDPLELNHNRRTAGSALKHPLNRVIGLDLKTGRKLWTRDAADLGLKDQTLNLEAAGWGAVSVAIGDRTKAYPLAADTGKLLEGAALKEANGHFFRFRNHICTPYYRVNGLNFANRGGTIYKDNERFNFGGARSACLTGTVPAYGAGYIAQNWCNCSPGQIPGLIAVASIGRMPTPAEMEQPARPIPFNSYSAGDDAVGRESDWSTFRGNASRSSAVATDIPTVVSESWKIKVAAPLKPGTVAKDWNAYLNSRLTAPVLSEKVALVADIDHNEVIAVSLDNGKVAWRFTTAGRMDTPPTAYKGLCLVGDHSGHVFAIKVKTGELVYRLRIAPEEKRMMSYGKLESVWPVIGGVLVAEGRAYATAGRTQGSDGGIVVRAFEPETGEPLWARAIPQTGNGVNPGKAKRNDALILEDKLLRLMDHSLDPATGKFVKSPTAIRLEKALAAREKELGRKLTRQETDQVKKATAAASRALALGNEGLYSWNWTRLGYRKFQFVGFEGVSGETVAWKDGEVVGSRQNALYFKVDGQTKTVHAPEGCQGTALVVCNNLLVQGGALIDRGDQKGFIRAVDLKTGKLAWEKTYSSQLAFNGLAVDQGQIIAAFDDGSVVKLK